MGPTGEARRILQIHPTRRCNLRCLHCYSSSGPEERDELSSALLQQALIDASAEGYTVASFAGGEPLLYKPLYEVLEQARQCGMSTTVTSNGMLLNEHHLERLAGAVDLMAISLDGIPASHNRMRGSEQAFDTMAKRLEGVRQSGIPFGFIFTLTQHNLHELEWAVNFALEQGASLLQIHPLEGVGRAGDALSDSLPDKIEAAYAYLEVARLKAVTDSKLTIHLDLLHRDLMLSNPSSIFADRSPENPKESLLSTLVSPLIIEADGTVVPIEHGFPRRYALGNLREAVLPKLSETWKQERYPIFRDLCLSVFEEVTASRDLPLVNWYEKMFKKAQSDKVSTLEVV